MQIDFHHTVTYVLSRMAGFPHEEADIIAYAAQYVDDCTTGGLIHFSDGSMYNRVPSAHTMKDIKHHLQTQENYVVWSIFHFLPGNEGKMIGNTSSMNFYDKIICKPDSDVARRMIDECIDYYTEEYALHRLGITMHVYADTYAHQGFAGIAHEINAVSDIKLENEKVGFFENILDKFKTKFLSKSFAMGHGAVLTHPDKPYLKWSYTDSKGKRIVRDNTDIFMDACGILLGELIRYRQEINPNFIPDTAYTEKDLATIKKNFETFTEQDGNERHKHWLASIENGDFSFGKQKISYIARDEGSWKYDALGIYVEDDADGCYTYTFSDTFMTSNYKRFHDALQEHRLTLLHDILPKYGICLA